MSNVGRAFVRGEHPFDDGDGLVEVSTYLEAPAGYEVDENVLEDLLKEAASKAFDTAVTKVQLPESPEPEGTPIEVTPVSVIDDVDVPQFADPNPVPPPDAALEENTTPVDLDVPPTLPPETPAEPIPDPDAPPVDTEASAPVE